jgi:hypothetical protein
LTTTQKQAPYTWEDDVGSNLLQDDSKAIAAGPMRPKAVTILTWIMAALNPLGYSLLWNPHKTRSAVVLLFLVFSAMIATGYLVLWFFWKGKNWARLVVLLNCFVCLYNIRYIPLHLKNPVEIVMIVGEAAVAVYLLWYLNTRRAKLFFKPDRLSNSIAVE